MDTGGARGILQPDSYKSRFQTYTVMLDKTYRKLRYVVYTPPPLGYPSDNIPSQETVILVTTNHPWVIPVTTPYPPNKLNITQQDNLVQSVYTLQNYVHKSVFCEHTRTVTYLPKSTKIIQVYPLGNLGKHRQYPRNNGEIMEV